MILVCQPMSQWANESISQSANQPNRDPVVRDQKVLPEVRNRPLLPRDFCRHSTFHFLSWSGTGMFGFTHPISDIPMTPSWSLRSFRNQRLACSDRHVDTDFEIYGSSIGVCIYVIKSNPIQSNPIKSNQIQSMDQPLHQIKSNQINESMNQIKSNQSTNQPINKSINQ